MVANKSELEVEQNGLCKKNINTNHSTSAIKERDAPVPNTDISQKTEWCSKAGLKLLLIASILTPFQFLGACVLTFSSPFIDELTLNLNSTPWNEGFKDCFYQTLIGPSGMAGAGLGGVLASALINVFGLVVPLVGTAALFALSWSMIGASWFVPSPIAFRHLFLAGRLLSAITVGLSCSIRPGRLAFAILPLAVYLGEISPNHMRTVLIASGACTYAFGTMVTFTLGSFLPYWAYAFIYAAIAVIMIPCIACLPESSIRTKNCITNFKRTISSFKHQDSKKLNILTMDRVKFGNFFIRLMMSEFLLTGQAFLGYILIAQYVGPILNVAGASKWRIPHGVTQALTIGLADFVGSLVGLASANSMGHITSCIIAAVCMCLGHTITGAFFSLTEAIDRGSSFAMPTNSSDISHNATITSTMSCFLKPNIDPAIGELYSPIAFLGMSICIFCYAVFWLPRQFNIIIDLFPDEMRELGFGIFITSMFISYTITSALFPIVENSIGTAAMFYTLAAGCACFAVLIPTLIPETMGTSKGEHGDRFTPRKNWIRIFNSLREFFQKCCSCKKSNPSLPKK